MSEIESLIALAFIVSLVSCRVVMSFR
ncbi:hypothetical protein E2C01_082634 [Portunus trituberculatus]|uniref:Uncharacterized protein n=1 Tax=Portunus trituberculatus TaxID=210409 RepID=A0A5B7IQG2_PORTR|nr:hypothetical protein [Portunus trituberculatus]